ncbi:hypothetical protein K2X33_15345 [bacterium]|nr:hypothetical protein [bacterium]
MRVFGLLLFLSTAANAVPVMEVVTADAGPLKLVWDNIELTTKQGSYSKDYYCRVRAKIEGFLTKQEAERFVEFYDLVGVGNEANHRQVCREWAVEKAKTWNEVIGRLAALHRETKKVANTEGERVKYSFLKLCYRDALQIDYDPTPSDSWRMHQIFVLKQTVACPKQGTH